jgi:hypothetical protein
MTISPSGIALNGIVGTPTGTSKVNTADVGEGITYYASPLYAAQAALTAESTAHPGSQNAIIILGDGAMNTQWIYFPQGSMWQWPTTNSAEPSTDVSGYSEYDTLKTTPNKNALVASSLSSPTQEASGTISGVYPDFLDECQQAIVAAQYATNHGTRVFSVAYGAAASGCTSGTHADDFTDVTLVTLPSTPNASFTLSTLTPCVTMENLASTLQDFYSDYLQSGGGVDGNCIDNSHSVTALSDIFQSIASTFSTPRLIPNDAT